MLSTAASDRGVNLVVRVIVGVAGLAFLFFVYGFVATLTGPEDRTPSAALFLGIGVLLFGLILGMSVWLLAEVGDGWPHQGRAGFRGSELQAPAIRACQDIILQLDNSLRVISLNPAAERHFKYSLAAANGMPIGFLLGAPAAPPASRPPAAAALTAETAHTNEEAHTSARRLAQRTGARLANLVQPLLGYTELALASVGPTHPACPDLAAIGRASARVVLLAHSLEHFGGNPHPHAVPLELNEFLTDLEADLRFLLEPTTTLHLETTKRPVVLLADSGLTRLATLLMACNAEESMPAGEATVRISVVPAGLQVSDTGPGFPKEVRVAMFKPLVTTKDPERGLGLGLHAARSAMRLQHGDVQLAQSSSSGSTITLSLPRLSLEEHQTSARPGGAVETGLRVSA